MKKIDLFIRQLYRLYTIITIPTKCKVRTWRKVMAILVQIAKLGILARIAKLGIFVKLVFRPNACFIYLHIANSMHNYAV